MVLVISMPMQIGDMLRCVKCKKPLVHAKDSKTGKISKYLYRWDCDCVPKSWRLSVG